MDIYACSCCSRECSRAAASASTCCSAFQRAGYSFFIFFTAAALHDVHDALRRYQAFAQLEQLNRPDFDRKRLLQKPSSRRQPANASSRPWAFLEAIQITTGARCKHRTACMYAMSTSINRRYPHVCSMDCPKSWLQTGFPYSLPYLTAAISVMRGFSTSPWRCVARRRAQAAQAIRVWVVSVAG